MLAPTADATFLGDRDHLTEAVLNLVDNAVKSTQEGDTISIGVQVAGDDVVIAVSDTGAGIAADDLDRIFDRFERGHDARHRYRGAGLGLSIVQSIAGAHGGRVEVASDLGVGTRDRGSSSLTHASPTKEAGMPRILIAEDDELISSFIEKGLRARGYSTHAVGDGDAARRAQPRRRRSISSSSTSRSRDEKVSTCSSASAPSVAGSR